MTLGQDEGRSQSQSWMKVLVIKELSVGTIQLLEYTIPPPAPAPPAPPPLSQQFGSIFLLLDLSNMINWSCVGLLTVF